MLLRHVKANPAGSSVFFPRVIKSPFFINNFRNKKSISALVMAGLLMGGSMSFAAENTVPGEVLYPVKVHVNETVRGTFAVTPKAKAEWDIRLVERRLEEVEELATKTDVSAEARQIAEANFGKYTERVHGRIAKFEEDEDSEDAILTAGELAEMLRTHEGVLAGLNTHVEEAVATSTGVMMATSTPSAGATLADDKRPLDAVLVKLRVGRGDAEKKHKELKKKYHKEDGDEDDNIVSVSQVSATVSEARTKAVLRIGGRDGTLKSTGDKKREEKHEEIRATAVTTPTVSTTTDSVIGVPTVTTEHTESRTEKSKDSEFSESRDNDND